MDIQRVQAAGVDINAMSGGYVGLCAVTFEGLGTLYVCQERARVDAKRAITFCTLRKGQEWAFMREYSGDWIEPGCSSIFLWLSLSTRLKTKTYHSTRMRTLSDQIFVLLRLIMPNLQRLEHLHA